MACFLSRSTDRTNEGEFHGWCQEGCRGCLIRRHGSDHTRPRARAAGLRRRCTNARLTVIVMARAIDAAPRLRQAPVSGACPRNTRGKLSRVDAERCRALHAPGIECVLGATLRRSFGDGYTAKPAVLIATNRRCYFAHSGNEIKLSAMETVDLPSDEAAPGAAARREVLRAAFTAAIFVSAALLFAVQPMFTKMVLPRLGGTPSVWSVAIVFFQGALLAGYAYAHWLTRYAGSRASVLVHLAVMVAACFALPLSIAAGWGRPP